jgi:glycine cleavage system H protein
MHSAMLSLLTFRQSMPALRVEPCVERSVSEIYTPLAGVVVAVNTAVQDDPSLLNSDPYGEGWMIEIRVDDSSMIDQLLTADAYRALTGE